MAAPLTLDVFLSPTKTCRGACGRELPMKAFGWKSRSRGERLSRCLECRAAEQSARRTADPEGTSASIARSRTRSEQLVADGLRTEPREKRCLECRSWKPVKAFAWHLRSRLWRKARCRPCDRAYRARLARQDSTFRARCEDGRAACRAIVLKAKSKPCMDCNRSFPSYVMDFDHRDPSQKVAKVSVLARRMNPQRLLEEIAKCDLVCANCHRIRTFARRTNERSNAHHDDGTGEARPG